MYFIRQRGIMDHYVTTDVVADSTTWLNGGEDWLDENPKYSVDNTVIFDSEETAKQALNACYGYLTTQDCFGQGVYEMSVGSSGLS